jgi:hypothetical protein
MGEDVSVAVTLGAGPPAAWGTGHFISSGIVAPSVWRMGGGEKYWQKPSVKDFKGPSNLGMRFVRRAFAAEAPGDQLDLVQDALA